MVVKANYTTDDGVIGLEAVLVEMDDNTPISEVWSLCRQHNTGRPCSRLVSVEILSCIKIYKG